MRSLGNTYLYHPQQPNPILGGGLKDARHFQMNRYDFILGRVKKCLCLAPIDLGPGDLILNKSQIAKPHAIEITLFVNEATRDIEARYNYGY